MQQTGGSSGTERLTPHLRQCRVGHLANWAQWMMRRNEVFQAAHCEQALGDGIGAAHKARMKWVVLEQRFRPQFGRHLREYFSTLLDELKICQSFVRYVTTDKNDAAITRSIIALASNLGLSVIAEGVDTEDQRQFLANEGCISYQGYLCHKPLPAHTIETCMRAEHHA